MTGFRLMAKRWVSPRRMHPIGRTLELELGIFLQEVVKHQAAILQASVANPLVKEQTKPCRSQALVFLPTSNIIIILPARSHQPGVVFSPEWKSGHPKFVHPVL